MSWPKIPLVAIKGTCNQGSNCKPVRSFKCQISGS